MNRTKIYVVLWYLLLLQWGPNQVNGQPGTSVSTATDQDEGADLLARAESGQEPDDHAEGKSSPPPTEAQTTSQSVRPTDSVRPRRRSNRQSVSDSLNPSGTEVAAVVHTGDLSNGSQSAIATCLPPPCPLEPPDTGQNQQHADGNITSASAPIAAPPESSGGSAESFAHLSQQEPFVLSPDPLHVNGGTEEVPNDDEVNANAHGDDFYHEALPQAEDPGETCVVLSNSEGVLSAADSVHDPSVASQGGGPQHAMPESGDGVFVSEGLEEPFVSSPGQLHVNGGTEEVPSDEEVNANAHGDGVYHEAVALSQAEDPDGGVEDPEQHLLDTATGGRGIAVRDGHVIINDTEHAGYQTVNLQPSSIQHPDYNINDFIDLARQRRLRDAGVTGHGAEAGRPWNVQPSNSNSEHNVHPPDAELEMDTIATRFFNGEGFQLMEDLYQYLRWGARPLWWARTMIHNLVDLIFILVGICVCLYFLFVQDRRKN